MAATRARSNQHAFDMCGKRVVVTGGNSGIGKATVIALVRRGADVVFTARDEERGRAALAEIEEATHSKGQGSACCRPLDLASFQSIRSFASAFLNEFQGLDVVVHNAGTIQGQRRLSEDRFELTFQTNHLGPFLLQHLLGQRLSASASARIVVVASSAHTRAKHGLDFDDLQAERGFDAVSAYSASKLANILFTRQLAKRLEGSATRAFCLHPGVVASAFNSRGGTGGLWGFAFRHLRPLLQSPQKGARTSVFLCCAPDIEAPSGSYFVRCHKARPSPAARDDGAALALWGASSRLCGLEKTP